MAGTLVRSSLLLFLFSAVSGAGTGGSGGQAASDSIEKRNYVVAGLPVGDQEHFMNFWKPTFDTYLNEVLASQYDDGWTAPSFELRTTTLDEIGSLVRNEEIDFAFTDPGAFSCLELSYGLQALATVAKKTPAGMRLDGISAAIITRADNAKVQVIGDLKDKVIAASSIISMAAGQVQALTMREEGLSFVQSARQVVLMGENQEKIVEAVLSGAVDVGFVRSDLLEQMEEEGKIATRDFKFIHSHTEMLHGVEFPYPVTGRVYPSWPFSALSHIPPELKTLVARTLMNIPSSHPAAAAGHYAMWEIPLSYSSVRTLQEEMEMTIYDEEERTAVCKLFNDTYSHLHCPERSFKLPRAVADGQCAQRGRSCPEGSLCYCRPCQYGSQVEIIPMEIDEVFEQDLQGDNASLMCDKMSVCGSVQQNQPSMFTVVDFMGRDNLEVTYKAHFGEHKVDGVCEKRRDLGEGWCAFNLTSYVIGDHILEVWVNGVQIESSPLVFVVETKDCGKGRRADEFGTCKCSGATFELEGKCQSAGQIIPAIVVPIVGGAIVLGALWVILPKLGYDQHHVFRALIWPFKVLLITVYMVICGLLIIAGVARAASDSQDSAAINVRKKRPKLAAEQCDGGADGRPNSVIAGLNKALGLSDEGKPVEKAAAGGDSSTNGAHAQNGANGELSEGKKHALAPPPMEPNGSAAGAPKMADSSESDVLPTKNDDKAAIDRPGMDLDGEDLW